MVKIIATQMKKDCETAEKELQQLVKGLIFTRLIKRSYEIEEALLLYVPYAISEYNVLNAGKTRKAKSLGHVFISTEVGSGRMKTYTDIEGFDATEIEVEDNEVTNPIIDMKSIKENARKELVLKVLPQNLKSWREYDVELVDFKQMFRPLWIIRYTLMGKMRVFKTFGDNYNM